MKLTEKQKMLLFQILYDSLRLVDNAKVFGLDNENRTKLYNEILKQQDELYKKSEPLQ